MNNKLVVIGDSFAGPCCYAKGYEYSHFWCDIIKKRYQNIDVYVNGDPSRDIQTIIDIWIKILPFLTKKDKLIIILPYFIRTRLPLDSEYWYNSFDDESMYLFEERFFGTDSYDQSKKIEYWGNHFSKKYFKNLLESQEMINASKASQLNHIDVIESLKVLSPPNTYVMSWDDMEYKSDYIDDKGVVTEKIGMWETLADDWVNSNGEIGKEGDFHWGINMNEKVAEYIIKIFNLKDE